MVVCVRACWKGCTLCDSGSLRARLLLTGTRVSDLRRAVTPATAAASPSDTSLLVGEMWTRVSVCVCVGSVDGGVDGLTGCLQSSGQTGKLSLMS